MSVNGCELVFQLVKDASRDWDEVLEYLGLDKYSIGMTVV